MGCPICGTVNTDGAIFCQKCGLGLGNVNAAFDGPASGHLDNLARPRRSWVKRGRNLSIVVIVVVIIAILVTALSFFVARGFLGSQAPALKVVQWLTGVRYGDPDFTANATISALIGGNVFTQTVKWYSDFFAEHRGQYVGALGVAVAPNGEVNASMQSAIEDAILLLDHHYGLVVTDHCYVHFQQSGFENTEKHVGMLKVGNTWYVAYATNVVDLGNI